jgi:hypothetical protein
MMGIWANYFGTKSHEGTQQDVPTPGSKDNPWIGAVKPGAKGKDGEGISGAQRNRARRAFERAERKAQKVGNRTYNREQQRRYRLAQTRAAQLRVLKGEVGTPAMQENLNRAVEALAKTARVDDADRDLARGQAVRRRSERLYERRLERFRNGTQRGKDLLWEYIPDPRGGEYDRLERRGSE